MKKNGIENDMFDEIELAELDDYEDDIDEFDYNKIKEEYGEYHADSILEFHNLDDVNYEKKRKSKGIFFLRYVSNNDIGKNIKIISKRVFYGGVILLVIFALILICVSFCIMFFDEEFGYGIMFLLIGFFVLSGLLFSYYFMFLLTSGYGLLIEDLHSIKNVLVQKDNQDNFDDLPRL